MLFGGITNSPTSWNATIASGNVPFNLKPATVGASIKESINGQKSNSLPLKIIDSNATLKLPQIDSVDPKEPTPGSFITITGKGFGDSEGQVTISENSDGSCPGESCINLNSPSMCGDSWSDSQIVVQMPGAATPNLDDNYYVTVLNSETNLQGVNKDVTNLKEGNPLPGLCSVAPKKGPAPLPENAKLTLLGDNLDKNATLYFFKKGADPKSVSTWISSAKYPVIDKNESSQTKLITVLPAYEQLGVQVTMSSGPIRAQVGGKFSNAVNYEVNDCTQDPEGSPGKDWQCCNEGPEQGLWKKANQACAGEVRDAGYVWRFTTGNWPNTPKVIEQTDCSDKKVLTSPSPWRQQPNGEKECINAKIGVRFTTPMDKSSISQNNVKIYECDGDKEPECDKKKTEIAWKTVGIMGVDALEGDAGIFKQNTWYRVELSDKIQSQTKAKVNGVDVIQNEFLLATRPCGAGTAYCYEFKTGDKECKITGAGVTPAEHVTHHFGVVQHPGYPIDPFVGNPAHPLTYKVWGTNEDSCASLQVEGLGWKWSPQIGESNYVHVFGNIPDIKSQVMVLSSSNDPVVISSTLPKDPKDETSKDIIAESKLFIDVLDPIVTFSEPTCIESCINPLIRATFNRHMVKSTYLEGFAMFECTDATCSSKKPHLDATVDQNQSTNLALYVSLSKPLKTSTYYLVSLNDKIKAFSGSEGIIGKPLEPKEWTFRTQADATACAVSHMSLDPAQHVEKEIGGKKIFSVTPFSGPNKCSKKGQALNKWDYEYKWSTNDAKVASVTNFQHTPASQLNKACGLNCVPNGSDIPRSAPSSTIKGMCGDGFVSYGEDCDIAIWDEVIGQSCTMSCLRPGNTSEGTCGDGKIDFNLGEECDTKHAETGPYCTDTCTWKGSTSQQGGVGAICGDSKVDLGEECDPGTDKDGKTITNDPYCSSSCLNLGKPLAASYCEALTNPPAECGSAKSVCGNVGDVKNNWNQAKIENSEECEIVFDGNTKKYGLNIRKVAGLFFLSDKEDDKNGPAKYCSDTCQLQNVCELSDKMKGEDVFVGGFWCQPGTEGCNADCRITGSSIQHSVPSMCGDGITGTGEYGACELDVKKISANEGPMQVTTAIGQLVTKDHVQKTFVQAELASDNKIVAKADYFLQCGFTEVKKPAPSTPFNDCPNQGQGVSSINSCCYPRPKRTEAYPKNGAGISDNKDGGVCRNTAIFAVFDKELKQDTIEGNVALVRGYKDANHKCLEAQGEKDATGLAKTLLSYKANLGQQTFWESMWIKVKVFLVRLVGGDVSAVDIKAYLDSNIKVWCAQNSAVDVDVSVKKNEKDEVISSTLVASITNILAKDSVYAVILKSGPDGIQDTLGVSIFNPDSSKVRDDIWVFKTKGGKKVSDGICKIEKVEMDPVSHLFNKPEQKHEFLAKAYGINDSQIVKTPAYDWEWDWQPQENPVFDIPAVGFATNTEKTQIASRNVQGTLTTAASVVITKDISETGKEVGKSFAAVSDLTAEFCEKPWPAFNNNGSWKPYQDHKFNFSFKYCSDAGQTGKTVDDLPFLKEIIPGANYCSLDNKQCKTNSDCGAGYPWSSTYKLDPTRDNKKFVGLTDDEAICYYVKQPEKTIKEGCKSNSECPVDYPICDWSNDFPAGGGFARLGCVAYDFPPNPIGVKSKTECPQIYEKGWYREAVTQSTIAGNKLALPQTCVGGSFAKAMGVTKEKVVKKFGSCSYKGKFGIDPQISCIEDSECNRVYNFPGDENSGDPNKDKLCESTMDAKTLKDNNCTTYGIPEGKGICRAWKLKGSTEIGGKKITELYPYEYNKPYQICSVDSDCAALDDDKEGDNDAWTCNKNLFNTSFTKIIVENNSCIGAEVQEIVKDPALENYFTQPIYRSLFFDESLKTEDVIGLQIFNNNGNKNGQYKRLSASEWYAKRFPNAPAPQVINVAGYDGVKVGNNYYINAMNIVPDGEGGLTVYSNIYVFSVNEGSKPETDKVFEEILGSLNFNTNMSDNGYCVSSSVKPEEVDFMKEVTENKQYPLSGQLCNSDFDCLDPLGEPLSKTNGICSNAKTKFLRDWDRFSDVKQMQNSFASYYKDNKTLPELKAGSFIPGYALSRWSSWNKLGSELGSGLPTDPLNDWTQCQGANNQTCWNTDKVELICPAKSSVYEYVYKQEIKDGQKVGPINYNLHVPFEYFVDKNVIGKEFGDEFGLNMSVLSIVPHCTPAAKFSPFGGSCGDGVVQPNEQCDPAGSKKLGEAGDCEGILVGENCIGTCSSQCKWEYKTELGKQCGNGIVEANEKCDDGALNGTYGHCNAGCVGAYEEYCGNLKIEEAHETCDPSTIKWNAYDLDRGKSCNLTCDGVGLFCGDKIESNGEECDDGNTSSKDGCSSTCKKENLACKKQLPQYRNFVYNKNFEPGDTYKAVDATEILITMLNDSKYDHLLNAQAKLKFYEGTQHINECFATTGDAVCSAFTGEECITVMTEDANGSYHNKCNVPIKDMLDPNKIDPAKKRSYVTCKGTYKGDIKKKKVEEGCGNLEVEEGEICDEGVQNGLACKPEYDKSCTYCAVDCKKVLTVDPVLFCGNGKIEALDGEKCDYEGKISGEQTKVFKIDNNKIVEAKCDDKGQWSCDAQCKAPTDNCITCGITKPGNAAHMYFINPMLAGGINSPQKWPVTDYHPHLYRPIIKGKFNNNALIGTGGKLGNTNNSPGFPFDSPTNQKLGNNNSFVIEGPDKKEKYGLESNELCKDEYIVHFNFADLTKNEQNKNGIGNYALFNQYYDGIKTFGDTFAYNVNGEAGLVENEMVFSPAVPENVYRIVVKWTKKEHDQGIKLIGGFYSEQFAGSKYMNALSPGNKPCEEMEKQKLSDGSNYWWPKIGAEKEVDVGKGKITLKCGDNDGIYVHPTVNTKKTHIQSFTVVSTFMKNNYAFFVQTVGQKSGPIAQHTGADIEVEVYEYHEGQKGEFSVYKPTKVYSIKKSVGTSSYSGSKYWYVFNMVPKGDGTAEVKGVEKIKTDIKFLENEYQSQK